MVIKKLKQIIPILILFLITILLPVSFATNTTGNNSINITGQQVNVTITNTSNLSNQNESVYNISLNQTQITNTSNLSNQNNLNLSKNISILNSNITKENNSNLDNQTSSEIEHNDSNSNLDNSTSIKNETDNSKSTLEDNSHNQNENEDNYNKRNIFILHDSLGAKIKFLQLQFSVENAISNGNLIVKEILNNNITTNLSNLNNIIAQLESINSTISTINLSNQNKSSVLTIFVSLKQQARNLTYSFKSNIRNYLNPTKIDKLRLEIENNNFDRLKIKNQDIRELIRQFNYQRMLQLSSNLGLANNTKINSILHSNISLKLKQESLIKSFKEQTKQKRKEILDNLRVLKAKRKVETIQRESELKARIHIRQAELRIKIEKETSKFRNRIEKQRKEFKDKIEVEHKTELIKNKLERLREQDHNRLQKFKENNKIRSKDN